MSAATRCLWFCYRNTNIEILILGGITKVRKRNIKILAVESDNEIHRRIKVGKTNEKIIDGKRVK